VIGVSDNGDVADVFHGYVLILVGVQRARNMGAKKGGVNEYAGKRGSRKRGKAIDRAERIP
jgi:hypothetical protein